MSTGNASHVLSVPAKVVQLSPRQPGGEARRITQQDKLEAVRLSRAISAAKKAYKQHMEFLEQAYRAGAVDEPGELMIEEVLHSGGGTFIEKWSVPGIRIVKQRARRRKAS